MRTLIIGDSQAAGVPGEELQVLLELRGDAVVRRGFSGHGAADWRRIHWPLYLRMLETFQPDRVVLIFGSNDLAGRALHAAMVAFLQSTRVPVYYAGPPRYDRNPAAQERGKAIRQLAMTVFGPRHLDAWPSTGPEARRSPNGLHFTREGGKRWARALYAQLRDVEASGVGLFIAAGVAFAAAAILWATLNP